MRRSVCIKKGVEVFGVTGSYTDDANAVASDVKTGKTFYANGQKISGNMNVYNAAQQTTLVSNSGGGWILEFQMGILMGVWMFMGLMGILLVGILRLGLKCLG